MSDSLQKTVEEKLEAYDKAVAELNGVKNDAELDGVKNDIRGRENQRGPG